MPDCTESNKALKFVAVAQFGTLIAMLVFVLRVYQEYTDFSRQYAHLQQKPVDTPQQFQALCTSKASLDKFQAYRTHFQVVFYTTVASFILNLIFIASFPHLPSPRLLILSTSFLLFAAGVVSMSFSAAGFSTIRNNLKTEPPECQQLFKNLKSLFLVGIVIGTTQAVFAASTGYVNYTSSSSPRTDLRKLFR